VTVAVLVVEDEALVRAFAAEVLEEAGYEVIEAPSADFALLVLGRRPDVVIVFTDVDMPGRLTGLDLARLVENHYPGIRIIIASGRTLPESTDMPAGAIFFEKPYASEALLKACNGHAQRTAPGR
jgi:two-component system, response regulator PdtaR